MAANDIKSLIELINNEFPDGDLREHLEYLKAAYEKHQKRQKLISSVADKLVTGGAMATIIFVGNAILAEVKKFFGGQ